ncbi:rhomboid family intramembrane serine protease [Bacillus kwashiorkori]|uniref:rhomboid family intramembrane serine protease n=1 Tax=Bacillus kwashiorkori TaxID=1522318 RepID=UPI0007838D08|nr:rhomboid family intramembrane serine protease [Bacillus kwashiorkori]
MIIKSSNLKEYAETYPITFSLLMINLIFFVLLTVPVFPNQLLFEKTVGVNILITIGEWWRLITPIFVHNHLTHLLFNCFSLFLFGSLLEGMLKKSTFFLLYLSSGIFANVMTYLLAPPTYVHAGASGAIFGILGVIFTLILFKRLPKRFAQTFIAILVINLLYTFLQPEINHIAHISGFLWGMIGGYYVLRR